MSVEDQQTAEVIMSIKGRYNAQSDKMEAGSIWRYITARISGDKLEFVPRDGAPRTMFEWRDANSGSYSTLMEQQVGGNNKSLGSGARFTRLDG